MAKFTVRYYPHQTPGIAWRPSLVPFVHEAVVYPYPDCALPDNLFPDQCPWCGGPPYPGWNHEQSFGSGHAEPGHEWHRWLVCTSCNIRFRWKGHKLYVQSFYQPPTRDPTELAAVQEDVRVAMASMADSTVADTYRRLA